MSIPSWAVKGAKVVCVRTAPPGARLSGAHYPEVDRVYTIRNVVTVTFGTEAGEGALLLEEIANSSALNAKIGHSSIREPGFPIDAFRPVNAKTQEEDVALFAPLLTATKIEERV